MGKSKSKSKSDWFAKLDQINDATRSNYFSVLPEEAELQHFFNEAFVINNPKGRVGGDGYWFFNQGSEAYLALFSCVGEGHLASMMIRIYMEALKKMVDGYSIDFPGSILQFLHREVMARFKSKNNILLNTNADVGIVKVDLESKQMEFAGANMNLLKVQRSGITIIEGEPQQVGETSEQLTSYPSNTVEYENGTCFYLVSPGVNKLIGGPDFKKLDIDLLASFFRENRPKAMGEQKQLTEGYLKDWIGSNTQNDDVLIIGFKL